MQVEPNPKYLVGHWDTIGGGRRLDATAAAAASNANDVSRVLVTARYVTLEFNDLRQKCCHQRKDANGSEGRERTELKVEHRKQVLKVRHE